MCLDTLDWSVLGRRSRKKGIGWKRFDIYYEKGGKDEKGGKEKLRFQYFGHNNSDFAKEGVWLQSKKEALGSCEYPPRFHIYLRKPPEYWRESGTRVVEVKWKDAVAAGWDGSRSTVVAAYILIGTEKKKEKKNAKRKSSS